MAELVADESFVPTVEDSAQVEKFPMLEKLVPLTWEEGNSSMLENSTMSK